ncbi:lycopene cyclase domain-containing protein [Halobacterium litoreum]|uniref:Lycopene cyclase domain-containing protein n=1 Tax=Halobacterium litoreum TaxID=2039234 RepID=A0ABD5NEM5_9EURY|nr:lycopene cyclase domain-containing protein [Halobacterium litoreum]UHH13542.1 lycopene cyclase domain-containing protein [Halobacterium litoreum]
MTGLTYAQFLVVFVAPVVAALAVGRARRRESLVRTGGVGVLLVLALAYTTPWDNYLVARGVWWYGDGTVLARVWHAPIEEYAFIALQTVATGLWVQRLAGTPDPEFLPSFRHAVAGLLAGGVVGVVGVAFLARDATFYLGAILAWAAPVFALQWAVGWRYLWARRRRFALAVAVPTLYLAGVDRIAIAADVWSLSNRYTTEIGVLGLPVEEGAFFLVTNLFVAQGLVLYDWVVARWG